jgi:hypothetical protein
LVLRKDKTLTRFCFQGHILEHRNAGIHARDRLRRGKHKTQKSFNLRQRMHLHRIDKGSSETHCGAILNRQNFLSHLTKRHRFVVHKGDRKQVDLMFHAHGVKDGESPFTGRTGGEVASRPVQAVVTPAHIAYYDSGQKCSNCDYFRVEPDVKHDPDHNFTDSRWLQHARGSTGAIRYFEAKWGGLFGVTDVFEWDRVCWAWTALRSRLEWVRELEEWVTVLEEFTRRSNDMDHE